MHGGSSPRALAAAKRKKEETIATEAVATYGLPVEIEPHAALLDELKRTAGHVAYLQTLIRALEDKAMTGPVGGAQGGYPSYEPHVYIRMYQGERKHLTDVAKTCISAGIEERRVRIIEELGQEIASFGRAILREFGIDPNSEQARKAFRKHLTLLEGEADEAA